jgi:Tfp pilus assembly protein PilO
MDTTVITASAKKRPIVFVCGAVSLICVVLLYVRSSKIEDNQADYEAKSAEAAKILANVRNSTSLVEQVAEIQALSKEMNSRLVRTGQLAVNLQYFYKLEAENEVKLVDIRQNGAPAARGSNLCVGVPYSVGVLGTFKQLMAFLNRVESGRHFCRFNSVNIATTTGGSATDTMNLTLGLELLGTP